MFTPNGKLLQNLYVSYSAYGQLPQLHVKASPVYSCLIYVISKRYILDSYIYREDLDYICQTEKPTHTVEAHVMTRIHDEGLHV